MMKDTSTELVAVRMRLKQTESSLDLAETNYKEVLKKLSAFVSPH